VRRAVASHSVAHGDDTGPAPADRGGGRAAGSRAAELRAAPAAGRRSDSGRRGRRCALGPTTRRDCRVPLDATPEAQAERLATRGDPAELLVHHQAFAEWMRRQASDPLYMTRVVCDAGWEQMRWDRLEHLAADWGMHTIDTTHMAKRDVADPVRTGRRCLSPTSYQRLSGATDLLSPPDVPLACRILFPGLRGKRARRPRALHGGARSASC
jgi:hypothetical protein